MKQNNLNITGTKEIFFSIAFLLIAIFSSCGRKKEECPKSHVRINYIGYDSTEVDSIRIYYFSRNSNFTELRDSHVSTNYFQFLRDTCLRDVSLYNHKNLGEPPTSESEVFDLKIVNLFDNKTTLLKDFTWTINFRKSGGFDPGTNHCQSPIKSYIQDGVLISDNENVYINK